MRFVERSDDRLENVVQHAQADMAAAPTMWQEPEPAAPEAPSTSSLMYALGRQGLKDLQNAVLDPWNGQVATHEEPGTIANPTQAMVTQEVGTVHGITHDAGTVHGQAVHQDAHLPQIEAPAIEGPQMEIGE